MFGTLVRKVKNIKLGPHDTIKKVLKCRCLKCLQIIYLDVMCMSYNKKKGKNQIPTLKNKGQMKTNWGVLYTIGNNFLRAIKYFLCIQKKKI